MKASKKLITTIASIFISVISVKAFGCELYEICKGDTVLHTATFHILSPYSLAKVGEVYSNGKVLVNYFRSEISNGEHGGEYDIVDLAELSKSIPAMADLRVGDRVSYEVEHTLLPNSITEPHARKSIERRKNEIFYSHI